ncbi:MAG TPA: thioredoxin family protein [Anaerohalosphaeraceae bacterium]|nr:thioredoxin family protein [Anaerohalosphaeraceae bacterium]HRT49700.1 thioredoxin family protein [Anaerohalosphaeraceae bacterium]HRT87636.1 thioredoxin family protein [Anaerohalosphaeraceae bacterium]
MRTISETAARYTRTAIWAIAILALSPVNLLAQTPQVTRITYDELVAIEATPQHDAVRPGADSAIALRFQVKDTWHFYADPQTAPGKMNLKIKPQAEGVVFADPVFPASMSYFDKSSGRQLQVFGGEFVIFLPFTVNPDAAGSIAIAIGFDGAICSETLCQRPVFDKLRISVPVSAEAQMDSPAFVLPQTDTSPPPAHHGAAVETDEPLPGKQHHLPSEASEAGAAAGTPLTAWVALPLAVLAGLVLNLMPCVWPVLPIIVMRLLDQSRQRRGRSLALGLALCVGIMLFFAALAAANIVFRVSLGTVFQWGDHFRNPFFLIGMALLLVVLALFMFGVFGFAIPSSVSGRAHGGKGLAGSVGMGFLAAVLATPCSFAILTAAFAWAQTQPLVLSTVAILLIGVGMAAPYLILTAIPGLLQAIPRSGRWMELLKQGLGFLLLVIAIKLVSGLPEAQATATLYMATVVGFCVWMWGGWVSYATPPLKKWLVRGAAVGLAVAAGFVLLGPKERPIDWQAYDAARITKALEDGRPVLIEFMADWCLSCRVVEKTVYEDATIAELIREKDVLAVRADTTLREYAATEDLKNVYNEPAVPVTILLRPDGEPVRLHGIRIGEALKAALETLPDKAKN